MKKTLTSQLKRYYRKVNYFIPKNYPHRKEIISSIHQDISSYVAEHPDIFYEDIIEHFGTPEEMTLSFSEFLSPSDIMTTIRKVKRRHAVIISTIIIAFFVLCGMIYHVYWVAENTAVEIDETIIIYPETEIKDPQLLEEYSKLLDDTPQTDN